MSEEQTVASQDPETNMEEAQAPDEDQAPDENQAPDEDQAIEDQAIEDQAIEEAGPIDEADNPDRESTEPRRMSPQPELKIIISMRGQNATLGIQKPGTDPHLETLQGDLTDVLREIPDILERVSRRWMISPRHPEHRKARESAARSPTPQGPETGRLF